MKKMFAILLALCMTAALISSPALADGEARTGTFGDAFTWHFDDLSGTLLIRGIGRLPDPDGEVPWAVFQDQIRRIIIDHGITAIPSGLFSDLAGAADIVLFPSLKEIGPDAFSGCSGIVTVEVAGTEADVEAFRALFDEEGVAILSDVEDIRAVSPEAIAAEAEDVILASENNRKGYDEQTVPVADTEDEPEPEILVYEETQDENGRHHLHVEYSNGVTEDTIFDLHENGDPWLIVKETSYKDAEGYDVTVQDNYYWQDEPSTVITRSKTTVNEDGSRTSIVLTSKWDGFSSRTETYVGDERVYYEIIRTDTDGELTSLSRETVTKDENGNRIVEVETYNSSTGSYSKGTSVYNGDDLVSSEFSGKTARGVSYTGKTTVTKDEKGNTITEKITSYEDGRKQIDKTYTDEEGYAVTENEYIYADGTVHSYCYKSRITTDENGRTILEEKDIQADGSYTSVFYDITDYNYNVVAYEFSGTDDDGNPYISRSEFDENGKEIGKTVTTTYPDGHSEVRKYDSDGNLIEGSGKSPTIENAPGLPG